MPLFDFNCPDCHTTFESLVGTKTIPECPACGGQQATKMLSGFAIRGTGHSHHDRGAPVKNDGGPHDSIGNQAAALRAKGKATCC